jgi:hypothetical protein
MNQISLETIKYQLSKNQYDYLHIQLYNNCVDEITYYAGKDEKGNIIYYTDFDTPRFGKRYFIHTIGKNKKFSVNAAREDQVQEKINACNILVK